MKQINVNVSQETRMVYLSRYTIGNDGENLQGNISFEFKDGFVDGTARLEYVIGGEKRYQMLTKVGETYNLPIKSVLTKKGEVLMQLVITEGTNQEEIPIFKSNVFKVYCNGSINAESEEPEEYQSWLEIANTKLNEIDQAIAQALNVDVNVYKEDNVSTITIKNQLGEIKQVNIFDGEKGERGLTGGKGADGRDAKINGVNTLNITAGSNIRLNQEGNTLEINATGGGGSYDDTELRNKINRVDEDLGITQQDVQELKNDVDDKIGDIDTILQDINTGGGVE